MLNFVVKSCKVPVCASLLSKRFAGHSKWSNIRHIKALKDTQKSILFQRLGRMMRIAIQEHGSSDPSVNLKLDQAISQARRANMPNTTLLNFLKTADANKTNAKSYQLTVKGPGGCMIIVDVFTDNLHQTKSLMTPILRKHSARFSDAGGRHLFVEKGVIYATKPESSNDLLEAATDAAIEAGAEDVHINDDAIEFQCAATSLRRVSEALEQSFTITSATVDFLPIVTQTLTEEELATCAKLLDRLEAMPETVRTSSNIA